MLNLVTSFRWFCYCLPLHQEPATCGGFLAVLAKGSQGKKEKRAHQLWKKWVCHRQVIVSCDDIIW